jgi:hypothetical protein
MSESNIREWTVDSDPNVKFYRFTRTYEHRLSIAPDFVEVTMQGDVAVFDRDTHPITMAPTDVVLAAIFRQAGVVLALRMVIAAAERGGDPVLSENAKAIRKAFGEALS